MTRGSTALAASPWLLPALFALVVGDAFLVVLPSETVVVALGALSATTGAPALAAIIPVAAAGAVVGDGLCYLIGRRIGLDRWRWQREGRIGAALDRVRESVHRRTAVLVFTARYVPFARIAVNLAAGAGRVPLRRYLPLSFAAGVAWACYNVAIGAVVGSALRDSPAARDRDLDPDRDRARPGRRPRRGGTRRPANAEPRRQPRAYSPASPPMR